MAKINYGGPQAQYFYVLADGKFHMSVSEDTPGAKKREYETRDGKKGFKWEIEAQSIEGKIESIFIHEGDYGKNINIMLANEEGSTEEPVVISLSASSNFGEDFMKKLPNIDIENEVKFVPYSFEDESGRNRRGVTLYQGEAKIESYYQTKKKVKKNGKEFEQTVSINGYPIPDNDKKKFDTDDWKIFFAQARKFLISETEKHPLYKANRDDVQVKYVSEEEEGISSEDIPF